MSTNADGPFLVKLLPALRAFVGHDLANQMVIVRGLVQLLEVEEKERLSAEGREYVGRLQGAAGKAQDMVQTLRELVEALQNDEPAQEAALAAAVAEAAAVLKQLCPESTVVYDGQAVPWPARLGRRGLQRALSLLLPRAAEFLGGRDFRLRRI